MIAEVAPEQTLSQEFTATGLAGALSELDPVDAEFELITADAAEDLEHAYGIVPPGGPQAGSCCCSSSILCCCCC